MTKFNDQEYFLLYYELWYKGEYFYENKESIYVQALTIIYWSYTTLTSVGFGDYCPRSDLERLVCIVVLLFGVSLQSYILGKFIEILDRYKLMNAEIEYCDELSLFLATLKRFNEGKAINSKLKIKIEQYFEYRWSHDQ
jgi:hypothetical protein